MSVQTSTTFNFTSTCPIYLTNDNLFNNYQLSTTIIHPININANNSVCVPTLESLYTVYNINQSRNCVDLFYK